MAQKKLTNELVKMLLANKEAREDLAEEMTSKIVDELKDKAIGKLLKDNKSLKDVLAKILQKKDLLSDLADNIDDDLDLKDAVSDKLKENTKLQKEVLGVIVKDNRFKKELLGQLKDEISGNDD